VHGSDSYDSIPSAHCRGSHEGGYPAVRLLGNREGGMVDLQTSLVAGLDLQKFDAETGL